MASDFYGSDAPLGTSAPIVLAPVGKLNVNLQTAYPRIDIPDTLATEMRNEREELNDTYNALFRADDADGGRPVFKTWVIRHLQDIRPQLHFVRNKLCAPGTQTVDGTCQGKAKPALQHPEPTVKPELTCATGWTKEPIMGKANPAIQVGEKCRRVIACSS